MIDYKVLSLYPTQRGLWSDRCVFVIFSSILFSSILFSSLITDAAPTAGDLTLMRSKQGEVEHISRQRLESLFSRLCPGRCELIDLRVNVNTPKAVGRVLPGFDTPTASEVTISGIEAKVMVDSSLPRNFRSNLPQMSRYRLSDLSSNVVITPIYLKFPQPQLPPTPPLRPEIPQTRPKPEPPAEPPKAVKPVEPEPKPPPAPPLPKEESLLDLLMPWVPLLVIMAFASLLFLLILRQLKQLQEALLKSRASEERPQPEWMKQAEEEAKDRERPMPELDELARRLKESRNVQNKVLRRWIADDIQEVAHLVHLLGASILNDLKQDRTLKTQFETLSQRVAHQRTPLSSAQAWRISHALQARLTAAHVLHDERAQSAAWEFLHGLSLHTLHHLFTPLTSAEQSHFISQLPVDFRGAFLNQLTPEQRQEMMLYAGAEVSFSRSKSIDFAHRLKRVSEELSPLSQEMGAQASLIIDMLNVLPFHAQLESLIPLERQRPEIAHAVLHQMCLEGVILESPIEALTEALIRTPFDEMICVMRGLPEVLQRQLLSASPPQQSATYLEELELRLPVRQADFLTARASFLHILSSALKREGIELFDLNMRVMSQHRA